jgi:hypothetical protein
MSRMSKINLANNIRMNKLQKKKLRQTTLNLLQSQKGKLHNLTYLSLRNKINDKRIDVVQTN